MEPADWLARSRNWPASATCFPRAMTALARFATCCPARRYRRRGEFASGAPGGLAYKGMQGSRIGVTPGESGHRSPVGQLRRLLGLGFGLAVIVGSTIGVGILRTPGLVAGHLHSSSAILVVWMVGGLYTLLGAGGVGRQIGKPLG